MKNVKKNLSLLGMKAEDKITGVKGVITSVCFDLYGCIQATINRGLNKEGKLTDNYWYDVNRLKITGKSPVIDQPNFSFGEEAEGKKGPETKASKF